jgi:quinohemoprotein ethanol dehydrogenase
MCALIVLYSLCGFGESIADTKDDGQWQAYGRTVDQTHYSPLTDINSSNISRLGLSWWFDIPGVVLAQSIPLEVDGKLYFATGYSVVRAVDATTGRLLWTYDPHVVRLAGRKLRAGWGARGIAFWSNHVYVGTHDGRLVCIDAVTGKPVWSVATTQTNDARIISGPPVVFNGKVMIGHAGDYDLLRHYVTTYDAATGKQLWRFFTVPGDPGKGFEDKAMAMAARTWSGRWWKYGGGGGVWNAMTYDKELNRVYIGTGNGVPVDRKIRSPGGGDNLFVASIVALDADTGEYVWHYQTNPGDTWDFDAVEDIELADLMMGGKSRRVLLQASKNGFFYVIDRLSGRLISADEFATVTWADKIDLQTGRPVERANARYESAAATIWPWPFGAHGTAPMAYNPTQHLAYIPVMNVPAYFGDQSIDLKAWKPDDSLPNLNIGGNFRVEAANTPMDVGLSSLLAWDPVLQRPAWRVGLPGIWNGGIAATAGNLVFQGRCDGRFVAYAADSGRELWSFDAQVGLIGAPITYQVGHRQFVSIIAGFGGVPAGFGPLWDARAQSRRLLTFELGGHAQLPPPTAAHALVPVPDPEFKANTPAEQEGGRMWYGKGCFMCHGIGAVAGGTAPDLRVSQAILTLDAFRAIVKDGALLEAGMPRFAEMTDPELEGLRQYIRSQARDWAADKPRRQSLSVH